MWNARVVFRVVCSQIITVSSCTVISNKSAWGNVLSVLLVQTTLLQHPSKSGIVALRYVLMADRLRKGRGVSGVELHKHSN